jgi:CO dehydrogenase maturation factor
MAKGLGVKNVFVVANKVRGAEDLDFVKKGIGDMELAGHISFSHDIMEADIRGDSPFKFAPKTVEEVRQIKSAIEKVLNA